ncbi:hypothetical protein AQF52_0731 [Streptomyces venezuelae]|nr:hypothetical protein AQF52_0731 [Streptomyces venezuelae]CUM43416.1 hypothetical protein BN2537_15797 [Streptomyces venezuelae]
MQEGTESEDTGGGQAPIQPSRGAVRGPEGRLTSRDGRCEAPGHVRDLLVSRRLRRLILATLRVTGSPPSPVPGAHLADSVHRAPLPAHRCPVRGGGFLAVTSLLPLRN